MRKGRSEIEVATGMVLSLSWWLQKHYEGHALAVLALAESKVMY